jgi:hypothetical protein
VLVPLDAAFTCNNLACCVRERATVDSWPPPAKADPRALPSCAPTAGGAARVKSEQDPSYDPGQQQQQHQLHGAAPWVKHEADLEADLKLQLQLLMQPALWASDGGEDFELKLAAAAAAVAAANAAAAAAAAVAQASGLPVAGAVGPPFDPWYDVAKGRYKPIKVGGAHSVLPGGTGASAAALV